MVFLHDAIDILNDDNRIIHKQADGEHHGEHGQRVDRKAGGEKDRHGSKQHHWHRDHDDRRRAHILQEEEHDDRDEHCGLQQCFNDFLDRFFNERRCVVGKHSLHRRREERRQFFNAMFYGLGGFNGIGAGRKLDGHPCSRTIHILAKTAVRIGAELYAGHIIKRHLRAVFERAQRNGPELFRGLHQRLDRDGGVQHLAIDAGSSADFAAGDLRVLRADGGYHILR